MTAWLLVDPRTPDLAAQVYRVQLFRQLGLAVWDAHWYGGHHLPGYSLLYPPLGALLGVRLLGALAALASTGLFWLLARSLYGRPAAGWGALAFAVAAVGDVWAGRITFALGVTLALASALLLRTGRPAAAALLAATCAAASPVAGALLGLAGVTVALASGAPRAAAVTVMPAALVVLALALLFPEGGYEPYPILSFAATIGVLGAVAVALGRQERTLRLGCAVYGAVCLACLVVHTPVGSNIERYGVLLAGPLLVCSRLSRRSTLGGVALVALAAWGTWVVWGPVRESAAVAGSPATSAAYYAPLQRFLRGVEAQRGPLRVEVPLTRSHWEAALLAPQVSLARGWEKQLDTRYDGALLSPSLSAASYHAWLIREAVGFVALPDVPLDPSSAREGRLVAAGLPYLRLVRAGAHWQIYEVLGARPLVTGPARLLALGHDSFTVSASAAGSVLVRVRYTRYWTVTAGHACVSRGPGGWTALTVARPGRLSVAARFSLAGAFGGAGCGAR